MSENKEFDIIIKNIQAVKPKLDGIINIDLGKHLSFGPEFTENALRLAQKIHE